MQQKKSKVLSKSWVEISRGSLINNIKVFRGVVGRKVRIVAVVKANAYGHGMIEVATILSHMADIDMFAVDSVQEALKLRNLGIRKPVIVLGYTLTANLRIAILNDMSLTVYDLHHLETIRAMGLSKEAKIHLKIETGMNRQGVHLADIKEYLRFIEKNHKTMRLEGVSTHFASADNIKDKKLFVSQLRKFNKALQMVQETGISTQNLLVHCAASAATFVNETAHFNTIRMGIGLYGLWPSEDVANYYKSEKKEINIQPVLSWKTIVAQMKMINKGEVVGYSGTWKAKKKTKIAVIPVGYADGFDRGFSNNGWVLIGKKYAPIVGRVAMNMFMVDVTKLGRVNEGDVVTLINAKSTDLLSADDLAERIGTINYEVVTRISPLLERRII